MINKYLGYSISAVIRENKVKFKVKIDKNFSLVAPYYENAVEIIEKIFLIHKNCSCFECEKKIKNQIEMQRNFSKKAWEKQRKKMTKH
jgi:adenylyl- and sulfurtransferase ThiI